MGYRCKQVFLYTDHMQPKRNVSTKSWYGSSIRTVLHRYTVQHCIWLNLDNATPDCKIVVDEEVHTCRPM